MAILKRGKVIVVSVQGLFYSEERSEGLGEPQEGNSHHRAPVIGFKRVLFDVRAHPVAVVTPPLHTHTYTHPPPPGGCWVSRHTTGPPLQAHKKKKKRSVAVPAVGPGERAGGTFKKRRKKKNCLYVISPACF